MNAEWHQQNRMPRNASREQRLAWHRAHQLACACRSVPASLRAQLDAEAPAAPPARSARATAAKPAARRRQVRTAKTGAGNPAAETKFMKLVAAFGSEPNVTFGGKGFGASGLKHDGKIFAMLAKGGRFVAKLPGARVDELVAAGKGDYFDPGNGRRMKEWLVAGADNPRWLELAREAHRFAKG
jgi:hypothetical protein